jgi:hypothetical protein
VQTDPALVGLPLYSSDGQQVGEIKEAGKSSSGQQAVRSQMNETLGVGSVSVVIDAELFQKTPSCFRRRPIASSWR